MTILNTTFLRLFALAAVPALVGFGIYLAGFHVVGVILMVIFGGCAILAAATYLLIQGYFLFLRLLDFLLGGTDHIPEPVNPVIQRVIVEHRQAK